jgi:hypothetical protein
MYVRPCVCECRHGCFKYEPIRTKFDMELHNVTREDLVIEGQNQFPVGQNLYRGHIYGPIQTKVAINLRNTTVGRGWGRNRGI